MDAQCGFRPGRSTMDQIFALQQIFEKSWEYAKEVNACFVDVEKAYDRIAREKLWAGLLQYGIDGLSLTAIKSLYMHSEVCPRGNSATTKPFMVSVGLPQACSFSPVLFFIYMDKIVKKSESCGGVKIGECTVQRLLFADDLVLLDSTHNGIQQALDRFSDACYVAGMKISTAKTETICQSEKFKHHGVSFASEVMRQFHRSVVLKRELCTKAKLFIFRSVYVPILTYGHECWIMNEKVRSRVPAAEMGFLRSSSLTLLDKIKSAEHRIAASPTRKIAIALVWTCDTNVPGKNSQKTAV